MEAEFPHDSVNTVLSPQCVHTHKKGQEQNHILYAFLNSPSGLGNVGAAESNTHAREHICAHKHTHTHTLLDSATSQRGLVPCQIGNWQTGKSQIILSQLDRDGLNVKMLLGSPRPEFPELWMIAKTYSTALGYSAMWRSRNAHKGPNASSCLVFWDRVEVKS